MMRKVLLAVLVALPGLAQMEPLVSVKPDWIETLPQAPGRLYAMGTAELSGSEGDALARASDRARLEVVTRLRATVRGSTSVTTRTSEVASAGSRAGVGDRQVRDEVSVGAVAEDLPGLAVDRTYADPKGRTAYALAYLDLVQAQSTLAARLDQTRQSRLRVGDEQSRQARWRLRKAQDNLNRLDEVIGLLAMTGAGQDLQPALQAERTALGQRLAKLESLQLPPLDLSKTSMALRTNVALPPGVEAYLEAQIAECGLVHRNLNPDLILDLTFAGGEKGPEFIFIDLDVYQGVNYRLDALMTVFAGGQQTGGTALTRAVPLQIAQSGSPEGMVNQFRLQFERRLPKLVAEVANELQ
jgi:hypothetical protein